MRSACLLACIVNVVLVGGVWSQEDPWPPLVTTCDVMPLIAKDLNKRPDLLSCASTSWPTCETINCQIASNSDQLELQLLPCWQHPAIWIKNRDIHGKMLYENIFASSGLASANIGGSTVMLNVTVVQRQITLGFGVEIAVPGVINQTTTIIPYRDIPLNLTECPGTSPDYPLLCKKILYMEQYIMTSYSNLTHDPALVPTCKQPDTKSCTSMACSWKDAYGTPIWHTYEFLPCSKPQGFNFVLMAGLHHYEWTFTESKVVPVNLTMTLNITVKHPNDQTLGFKVDILNPTVGVFTEISYTELPLSTSGCSHTEKPRLRPPPLLRRGNTLYKHPSTQVKTSTSESAAYKVAKSSLLAPQAPPQGPPQQARPLKTACDVMPLFVNSLNSIPDAPFACSPALPPCNRVFCNVTNGDQQVVTHNPCTNPPSIQIVVRNSSNSVLTNVTISRSGPVTLNFTNATIQTNFTIIQHTDYLTLGESVNATLSNTSGSTLVLPYLEIPMDRSRCPGVSVPPPMCAAMQNIAQYLNVYLSNATQDPTHPWDCAVSPSTCTNLTCSNSNVSTSIVLNPCRKMLTLYLIPGSPGASPHGGVVNISRSGLVQLDNSTTLVNQLAYNASTRSLGVQISIVYTDMNNQSLSMSESVIPYIRIPLNLSTCPNTQPGSALINTCDIMPYLASVASRGIPGNLTCKSSPPPNCNTINCKVTSEVMNDSLVFGVLPCHKPPAIMLVNRAANGSVRFNQTITNTTLMVEADIGDHPVILNLTVIQHPQLLTLGVGINASVVEGESRVSVEFIPYHEIPLGRSQCTPPGLSPTCQTMRQVAQYFGVFVSNITHVPFHCVTINATLCNRIFCHTHSGFLNMTFLPCGERIRFNILDGNATHLGYNHTIDGSTVIHFSNETYVNFTLEQNIDSAENAVTFQMDLYENGTFVASEVPQVVIPVDTSRCNATPPSGNHTHTHNDTTDSSQLIGTCDIVPYLAKATAMAIGANCTASTSPNCNTVSCKVISTNATLTYSLAPCHTPPAIRIIGRNASGNVTFNMTFVNTTQSVRADILGWVNPTYLNLTLVRHRRMLTMGVAIDVWSGNDVASAASLLPYFEIPLGSPPCDVCHASMYPPGFIPACDVIIQAWTYSATTGECEQTHFHPCGQPENGFNVFRNMTSCMKTCNNTDVDVMENTTCQIMDSMAQYMTVFLANLTHSQEHTPACRAVRPFCNSFFCGLPNRAGYYNMSFLPCNNPIGFSVNVMDTLSNINFNATLYESGTFVPAPDALSNVTLHQLDSETVGFALGLILNTTGTPQVFEEIPYVRIPLNTSVCNGPGPTPNTTHNNTHVSYSLIDTCDVVPLIARQASSAIPDALTCTSTETPNCNTISCIVMDSGERMRFTFLPCLRPPALSVSIWNRTHPPLVRNLTRSETLMASIGGKQVPLHFDIRQRATNLTMGFQVVAEVDEANVTFVEYIEVPLDRSGCPTRLVYGPRRTCDAMYNISQYINYALSSATREPTDCVPAGKCQEFTCYVGNANSSLNFVIRVCDVPQIVKAMVANPSGVVTAIEEIQDFSDTLVWDIGSQNVSMNVSLQHPDPATLGMQVTIDCKNCSSPVTMIPPVSIPLNLTGCAIKPPNISNQSLVTSCDITPLIARFTFTPHGIPTIMCVPSSPPGCYSITCSVPRIGDSVVFRVNPCNYNPPAVTVVTYVNGTMKFNQTSSRQVDFSFGSSQLPMRLSLVQHSRDQSLGFKVDVVEEDFVISFIPYREIPIKCKSIATLSPTCQVMDNIAQYMTIFMANYTNNANSTPDCYANRRTLCNNITCVMPSGDRYNYSFLPCSEPTSFNVRHTFADHTVVSDVVYSNSQSIQLAGQHNARLTLNHLDYSTVQIQITSDAGDFIPLVAVPLDTQLCSNNPHTNSPYTGTSTTTPQPAGGSSMIALYVTVPIAAFVMGMVLILLFVLAYNCLTRKKKSDEPYSYKPLSDQTSDGEDEDDDEEGLEKGMGSREDAQWPGGMGTEHLADIEKGEDN